MSVAVILEREYELERIVVALGAAATGEGRLVVIEGPAGIGKSRLVAESRTLAKERGFGRLQATADELESAIAWSVVRQMVERSLARLGGDKRARLMEGAGGRALALLQRAPTEGLEDDGELARTIHALWWIAVDLSTNRPLLITVDDAQWADVPSLRLLVYLSRRIADLPVALVIATRTGKAQSGPLMALTDGRHGEHLVPRPLSQEGVAALASGGRSYAAAEVIAALHAASGGNPFLVEQLLGELYARGAPVGDAATARAIGGLGPTSISRALLARLPLDAVRLAASAALLGNRCDPQLAARVAELDAALLPASVDALIEGHVLKAEDDGLIFTHPVIREALLAGIGPGTRAALHASAAVQLSSMRAPAQRIAVHLAAANPGILPNAASVLREAAATVLAEGDTRTGVAYLTRAEREQPGDQRLHAELGFALLRAGDPVRAREHLQVAALAAPSPHERAERIAGLATAISMTDGPSYAIAQLQAEVDRWPEAHDDASLILEARLALLSWQVPEESRRSTERLRRFADLPGATSHERLLLGLLAQRERMDVRPAQHVAALAARALNRGVYHDDVFDRFDGMVGWVQSVMSLIAADAIDAAGDEVNHARERLRTRGSPLEFGMVSNAAGALAWRTGNLQDAEAEAHAALAAVRAEPPSSATTAVRASAAQVAIYAALERGDVIAASSALDSLDEDVARRSYSSARLFDGPALIALASGNPARALRLASELGESLCAAHLDVPTGSWRVPAALAALHLGDNEHARSLACEQLDLAQRWGAASDIGAALRLAARVDSDNAVQLLCEAIMTLDASPARLELARSLVDCGEVLRVTRRRSAARDPLRRGADLARACRSAALQQRAVDALAALGDKPRRLAFSGADALTASERRVASLAVDGRTNRDIAHELFVTPKTVENHLGRVYIKLGISSRRQLGQALQARSVVDA